MSYIGKTDERIVNTSDGRVFKIFLTKQENNLWVSTFLYTIDGVASTKIFVTTKKDESFKITMEWILNNIDKNARIELV